MSDTLTRERQILLPKSELFVRTTGVIVAVERHTDSSAYW